MKFVYSLAVLMLSGLFILSSVFVPVSVSSRSDLAQVKLGGPLPFLVQDHSRYDPSLYDPSLYDPSLPWRIRFDSSSEVPTWMLWPHFLLDAALVSGSLVIILRVILAISSLLPQRLLRLLPQFLQPLRSEPMKSAYRLGVLMLSGLLVLVSLFVPVTVSNKSDLVQMKLGLPLPFVVQDLSRYDPPFPWRFGLEFNPWETPMWILWPQFLVDVALVFGVIVGVLSVFKQLFLKTAKC